MFRIARAAFVVAAAALICVIALSARAQQAVTLHGAVQFNDDHAFNKTLLKFEDLVKQYYGKPINFVLHRNSELGLEKDYFAYMNQGISVDYGIVSPAHMSTFSKAAPFLFRDLDHWNKVLGADLLKPIADEIAQKADVMLIGYAGGGVRNIFVIAAGENEAAGVEQMKFYEVGPNLSMTEHAITIRPICFSGKTFKKLPPDLQAAITKAGKEAGAYGRQIESSEDSAKLDALEKAGKLKRIAFADRAEMKKLVDPVMAAYAKEIGADTIFGQINAIK
jgi:TRAP-type C4-dicarboxylate transport system substrate-binding protein